MNRNLIPNIPQVDPPVTSVSTETNFIEKYKYYIIAAILVLVALLIIYILFYKTKPPVEKPAHISNPPPPLPVQNPPSTPTPTPPQVQKPNKDTAEMMDNLKEKFKEDDISGDEDEMAKEDEKEEPANDKF